MKPKVGDKVQVVKFGGTEQGTVIDYDKSTNTYTVMSCGSKWSSVPYKIPKPKGRKKWEGPVYIEKVI